MMTTKWRKANTKQHTNINAKQGSEHPVSCFQNDKIVFTNCMRRSIFCFNKCQYLVCYLIMLIMVFCGLFIPPFSINMCLRIEFEMFFSIFYILLASRLIVHQYTFIKKSQFTKTDDVITVCDPVHNTPVTSLIQRATPTSGLWYNLL